MHENKNATESTSAIATPSRTQLMMREHDRSATLEVQERECMLEESRDALKEARRLRREALKQYKVSCRLVEERRKRERRARYDLKLMQDSAPQDRSLN